MAPRKKSKQEDAKAAEGVVTTPEATAPKVTTTPIEATKPRRVINLGGGLVRIDN